MTDAARNCSNSALARPHANANLHWHKIDSLRTGQSEKCHTQDCQANFSYAQWPKPQSGREQNLFATVHSMHESRSCKVPCELHDLVL